MIIRLVVLILVVVGVTSLFKQDNDTPTNFPGNTPEIENAQIANEPIANAQIANAQIANDILAEQPRILQELIDNYEKALKGNPEAFNNLQIAKRKFKNNYLDLSDHQVSIGPYNPWFNSAKIIARERDKINYAVDNILSAKESIIKLAKFVAYINDNAPVLQAANEKVISSLVKSGASTSQIDVATRQSSLVTSIVENANKILHGADKPARAADKFGREMALFIRVLDAMIKGHKKMNISQVSGRDARDNLIVVAELSVTWHDLTGKILDATPVLLKAQDSFSYLLSVKQEINLQ